MPGCSLPPSNRPLILYSVDKIFVHCYQRRLSVIRVRRMALVAAGRGTYPADPSSPLHDEIMDCAQALDRFIDNSRRHDLVRFQTEK